MKGLIFTYGITYGGAVVALIDPFLGLLAWVIYATLKPETLWYWSVPASNYGKVIAIALLAGWVLHGMGNWKLGKASLTMAALLAYGAWKIVGALFAPDQTIAWEEVDRQARILIPVVVGITLVDSLDRLRKLAWVCVLSIGYVGLEANMDHFQGGSRLEELGFFGADNNSACIALVTGMGMAFFLGLGESAWYKKWPLFFISGLLAHCPLFGDSRGGMLGAACTGVATAALLRKDRKHWWLLGLAMICVLSLAGERAQHGWASIFAEAEVRDASAESRIELWKDCWDAMLKHPIVGLGPDHWEIAAKYDYGWGTGKAAHSLWFNAGAEMGFPGLVFLLTFYFSAIWQCWPIAQSNSDVDPFVRTVARMVVAGLVGFVVSASFVALDRLEPPYFVVMLAAGCIRVAQTQSQHLASLPGQFRLETGAAPAI